MEKRCSNWIGIALILAGSLFLALILAGRSLGVWGWWWAPWRLWPLGVVGVGLSLVLIPLLALGQRGLGLLFILGIPILVTGGNLLFASLLNWWSAWTWLWPLEILGLGLGFLLAAVYTRWIWLVVPALVLGLNGLAFQFCAFTGWWGLWSILWTVEPLSLGLGLLVVGSQAGREGLVALGLVVCGLANPASVYCEEQGYKLEIRTDEQGSYGVCLFPDGSECDEWAFFRGECGPAE